MTKEVVSVSFFVSSSPSVAIYIYLSPAMPLFLCPRFLSVSSYLSLSLYLSVYLHLSLCLLLSTFISLSLSFCLPSSLSLSPFVSFCLLLFLSVSFCFLCLSFLFSQCLFANIYLVTYGMKRTHFYSDFMAKKQLF